MKKKITAILAMCMLAVTMAACGDGDVADDIPSRTMRLLLTLKKQTEQMKLRLPMRAKLLTPAHRESSRFSMLLPI